MKKTTVFLITSAQVLKILLILQIKTEVLIHQQTLCIYYYKKLLGQSSYVLKRKCVHLT